MADVNQRFEDINYFVLGPTCYKKPVAQYVALLINLSLLSEPEKICSFPLILRFIVYL